MITNFYSKRILRLLGLPILFYLTIFDTTILNKEINADKKLLPATKQDLFLYKGMGASYLCIASKAGIEFPKAVGIATATYVQVLEGKHGGLIKELGDKKLKREKLFGGAEKPGAVCWGNNMLIKLFGIPPCGPGGEDSSA